MDSANQTPEQEIEHLKKVLAEQKATIAGLESEKEKLTNEILFLRRQLFGRDRKSVV